MRNLLRSVPLLYSTWRKLRLSLPGRVLAGALAARITPARLKKLEQAALATDPSYAYEWPYLNTLLARTDLMHADGYAVDIAAGDGVTQSCLLPLFRDFNWRGFAVEQDATRFALLEYTYRRFPRVRVQRMMVNPDNVVSLLRAADVPAEPTLLNIDIDSYDLPVIDTVLTAYRPMVIDLEINEKIPPPIRFAVRASDSFKHNDGHCYGCSIAAASDVLVTHGYRLAGLQYNNAFFVRADVAERCDIQHQDPTTAYQDGYLQKTDRGSWFPWNTEMQAAQELQPEQAVHWLQRRFRNRTDYILQTDPIERTALRVNG